MNMIEIPCNKCGELMQRTESSINYKKSLGVYKFYHKECIPRDRTRGKSY